MQDCYGRKGWALVRPDMPVRFISGAEDPCRTSDKAFFEAVEFMKEVGYKDCSGKLYPGMRHEILNETQKDIVWNDILQMLA